MDERMVRVVEKQEGTKTDCVAHGVEADTYALSSTSRPSYTQFLIFRQLLAKVIVAEGRELDLEVGDEVLAMQRMPSPCLVVENVIRLVRTSNCDIVCNARMKDIRPMIEA